MSYFSYPPTNTNSSIGTVTSVDVSGGTTGLTTSGGPITTDGVITLDGTLNIAHGGTGQVTAAAAFNALSPMTTTGDIIYEASANTAARLAIGSTGNVLTVAGGIPSWAAPAISGTVTSVAMTVPGFLSIGGSPITTSGTLAVSYSGSALPVANGGTGLTSGTSGGILGYTASGTLASSGALTANQLIVGGGAGATPATLAAGSQFQVLIMGASNPGYGQVNLGQSAAITGTLPIGNGGTGQVTAPAAFNALSPITTTGDMIYSPSSATSQRLSIGSSGNVLTVSGGVPTWAPPATSGTVTSVAMTVPTFLSIGGSPITSSGTLAVSLSGTALPVANGGTAVTSVTISPTASSFAGWDANKNLSANSHINAYTTTATAAGTTTLVVGSTYQQYFTGSTTQTVVLPVTSTLVVGQQFQIINNSTGIVTVQSSGANTIVAMAAGGTSLLVTCILTSGTTAASWASNYTSITQAIAPTVQKFTSSTGTYTTPANVKWLNVKMVGGGGGGGGSGTTGTAGNGGNGASSTFGSSFLTSTGGSGGIFSGAGGAGGTASLASPAIGTVLTGGSGGGYTSNNGGVNAFFDGGLGAATPFGGAAGPGAANVGGVAAASNTGSGGSGGAGVGGIVLSNTGAGGGAAGWIDVIIPAPAPSYSYAVGAGGAAGTAGTSGFVGGAGGSGYIVVTEFY